MNTTKRIKTFITFVLAGTLAPVILGQTRDIPTTPVTMGSPALDPIPCFTVTFNDDERPNRYELPPVEIVELTPQRAYRLETSEEPPELEAVELEVIELELPRIFLIKGIAIQLPSPPRRIIKVDEENFVLVVDNQLHLLGPWPEGSIKHGMVKIATTQTWAGTIVRTETHWAIRIDSNSGKLALIELDSW